ncbi:MAG: cache domain-containing protein, partial [Chlamydiota bacterium]|nr:cache domain-containing protein [Chlamydiota bacterium]
MKILTKLLILTLAVSILPLIVVGVLAYQNGRLALENEIGSELNAQANFVIRELENRLQDQNNNIRSWSKLTVIQDLLTDDADGRVTELLMQLREEFGDYLVLFCTNAKGVVVASSDESMYKKEFSHEPWYKEMADEKTWIDVLSNIGDIDAKGVIVASPVIGIETQEKVIGAIVGFYDWNKVDNLLDIEMEQTQDSRQGYTILVNQQGTVIGSSAFGRKQGWEDSLDVRGRTSFNNASEGKSGYLIEKGHSGLELVGYKKFKSSSRWGQLGWVLLTVRDLQTVFKPVYQLRLKILMIGVVISILVIVVCYFFSRGIVNPIRKLIAGTSAMAIQMQSATQEQASGASEQSSTVAEASSTVEELASTAQQIAKNAQQVKVSAEQTLGGMKEIQAKVAQT